MFYYLNFIIKRFFYAFFVIIGLSVIIFCIARVVPGNPVRMALGSRAPEWAVEEMENEMHLDRPVFIQYGYWIRDVLLHGDFGKSLNTRRTIIGDIKEFFPASLELALWAGIFMGIFGVLLGVISGWFRNTWIDNLVRFISYIGVATPSYIWAIFFILIFGYGIVKMPVMGRMSPTLIQPQIHTGLITIDALISGNWHAFWDALSHLMLPAFSLAMGPMAQEARITRSSIADNIVKDYVASERASGISETSIAFKYLLKPSLIPTISIYGSIVGTIVVFGILFAFINVIVDITISILDPRIRLQLGGNLS